MSRDGNDCFALICALAFAGCTAHDAGAPGEDDDPATAPAGAAGTVVLATGDIQLEVPRDWLGYELGLKPPLLHPIDRVTSTVDVDEDRPIEPTAIRGKNSDLGADRLRATGPDGTIYEIRISDTDFEILHREMLRRGLTGASPDRGTEPPAGGGASTNGWSNGVDSRIKWPNTSSDWPRDTIGKLSSGCTGTLFEGRLVLTAFHCFWDGKGNWVGSMSFRAGQDGSSKPYGDVPHTWKYWSQNFLDNNCHKWKLLDNYDDDCEKYDWAVVVLASTPKNGNGGNPGWMGYWYNSDDDDVAAYAKYHRGYPACSAANAPSGCASSTLWGQSFTCATGDFFGSVGGWNRAFWHGCDASPGHSGGPLYSWSPGSDGPYLVGINLAESCTAGDCSGDPTPNVSFRIDKSLAEKMSYYRSVY